MMALHWMSLSDVLIYLSYSLGRWLHDLLIWSMESMQWSECLWAILYILYVRSNYPLLIWIILIIQWLANYITFIKWLNLIKINQTTYPLVIWNKYRTVKGLPKGKGYYKHSVRPCLIRILVTSKPLFVYRCAGHRNCNTYGAVPVASAKIDKQRVTEFAQMTQQKHFSKCCKTFSISRAKSQSLNLPCFVLQLSSLNPLKPGVKSKTKM